MSYWNHVSPAGAIRDFAQLWRDNPYRWRVLAVSLVLTSGFMSVAIPKSERIAPRSPDVTLITTFPEGRTREQIIESNLANQARKDARAAEDAARAEIRRDAYRALGRATGLDVEQMEREIAKEQAAERRAAEAAQAELRKRQAAARATQPVGQN